MKQEMTDTPSLPLVIGKAREKIQVPDLLDGG